MSGDSSYDTQASSIVGLAGNPTDPARWDRFCRKYQPAIRRWLGGKRLQPADVDDIAQEVLIKLVKKLPGFTYDPDRSFRAWLKTVVHNVWHDVVTSSRWQAGLAAGELADVAGAVPLAEEIEREYDQELMEWAMTVVKGRVAPATWEAFERTAVGLEPPQRVAADLGVAVALVYVHKSKVTKLIRETIRTADGGP
jgi:RNA polymerase sigma-70 factor (ECF subfamily)